MYSGGAGTINDPYLITTPQDLYDVRSNLSAYFKQLNDIDLTGTAFVSGDGWAPINSFSGDYNGYGKKIIGLRNHREASNQGLFGTSMTGHLHGIWVVDPDFYHGSSFAADNCGPLVAYMTGGLVEKCQVEGGSIYATVTTFSSDNIGGLIGRASGGTIQDCVSKIDDANCYRTVGAIVGYSSGAIVQRCAVLSANTHLVANNTAGGITGGGGTVQNCAVFMDYISLTSGTETTYRVSASSGTTMINNYAYDGISMPRTAVSNANGQDGLDKTLSELKTKSTYETGLGWDFKQTWRIKPDSLPELRIFADAQNALFFGTNF